MALNKNLQFQDITAPEYPVEVEIRSDGKVLWVHVDGITVLRICQMKHPVQIIDGAKNA